MTDIFVDKDCDRKRNFACHNIKVICSRQMVKKKLDLTWYIYRNLLPSSTSYVSGKCSESQRRIEKNTTTIFFTKSHSRIPERCLEGFEFSYQGYLSVKERRGMEGGGGRRN